MMSEAQFLKMKPTAILINTARGAIVDEKALVRALSEGRIAGAGLDVYEELNMFSLPTSPPPHPLLSMKNVVLTPHSGGCSVESLEELMREGARQLAGLLRGEPPRNVVNPEVMSRPGCRALAS
jgi:phosphoglycerate dehydrogenase-like enzyme